MVASKSQLFNQRLSGQIPHYVTAYLNANSIIRYRANYNIIGMCRCIGVILAVHNDKLCPLFRVIRKKLYAQAVFCSFVFIKLKAG